MVLKPIITAQERPRQATVALPRPATPVVHCTVRLGSIAAAFATVPDPRRRQGTRYPLGAVLTLAVAAILCNQLTLLAIAEWGPPRTRPFNAPSAFPVAAP